MGEGARLGGFSEYQPADSRPASERTEVLIWFSPKALHVGVIAHDSVAGSVRATVADRDNIANDDWVRVYLDTFNDRRRAFIFGVNPLGAQEDGVQTEGGFSAGMTRGGGGGGYYGGNFMSGQVDLSPDYQFDSKGVVSDDGYVVEIRIPFKSLRYPGGGPMKWGINIQRKTQRTGRQDTWTEAKRVASFLAQAGTMEGLHDLQRGVVTELQPFVTGSVDGARRDDGSYAYGTTDIEPGANLRFGFTNISLDATVNPDFSQVETDATQVTVNERFALFYPEKRPFFLEGIELFATPNQLVYTRQIADPIAGGKVTGKVGKTGIAFLSAPDDTGDATAWFNIARIRQDVGRDSLAGLTYTDRTAAAGFNRVVAADARIVFKKLYYVLGQAGGSWTDRDGTTLGSPMWQGEFDRTARTWGFNYKLTGFGEHFETQSGYVPRNNIVEGRASNRLTYYGARGSRVESFSGFLSLNRIWEYATFGDAGAMEGGGSLNLNSVLRGGWAASASFSRNFVHFDSGDYDAYEIRGPGRRTGAVHGAGRRVELERDLHRHHAGVPAVQRQSQRQLRRHAHLRGSLRRRAVAHDGLAHAAADAVDPPRGQPGRHAHHPRARRVGVRAVDDPARQARIPAPAVALLPRHHGVPVQRARRALRPDHGPADLRRRRAGEQLRDQRPPHRPVVLVRTHAGHGGVFRLWREPCQGPAPVHDAGLRPHDRRLLRQAGVCVQAVTRSSGLGPAVLFFAALYRPRPR